MESCTKTTIYEDHCPGAGLTAKCSYLVPAELDAGISQNRNLSSNHVLQHQVTKTFPGQIITVEYSNIYGSLVSELQQVRNLSPAEQGNPELSQKKS